MRCGGCQASLYFHHIFMRGKYLKRKHHDLRGQGVFLFSPLVLLIGAKITKQAFRCHVRTYVQPCSGKRV